MDLGPSEDVVGHISCMCGQYRYSMSNPREEKLTRYHCDNATAEEEPLVTPVIFTNIIHHHDCRLVTMTGVTGRVKLTGIASRASREIKRMLSRPTSKSIISLNTPAGQLLPLY